MSLKVGTIYQDAMEKITLSQNTRVCDELSNTSNYLQELSLKLHFCKLALSTKLLKPELNVVLNSLLKNEA